MSGIAFVKYHDNRGEDTFEVGTRKVKDILAEEAANSRMYKANSDGSKGPRVLNDDLLIDGTTYLVEPPPAPEPSAVNVNNNNAVSQEHLSWAVSTSLGKNNYQIPLEKLDFTQLVERVKERGCSLVQGYYRSGKSSHCEALEAYLNKSDKYYCVRIALSILKYEGLKQLSIDEGINSSIRIALRKYLPSSYNFEKFSVQEAITVIKQQVGSKRVVVLWDEFQLITRADATHACADITEACRALVHPSGDAETIYSCLGFGTFALEFLDAGADRIAGAGANLSPFHRKPPILMKQAGKDDMRTTINQWLADRDQEADAAVVDSWIENSNGFLGIFSFIGYMLNAMDPSVRLSYPVWTSEFSRILASMAVQGGTFSRMIASVIATTCKPQLRPSIVTDTPITSGHDDVNYKELVDMASAGVFNREIVGDRDEFTISCPVVKHLVLHLFSPPAPDQILADNLLAPEKYKEFVSLLLTQLTNEKATLTDPLTLKTAGFPTEVTFQSLIFSYVKGAFARDPSKKNYIVLMETGQKIKGPETGQQSKKTVLGKRLAKDPKETRKRSDFFLKNGHRLILELKSYIDLLGKRKVSSKNDLLHKALAQVAYYAQAQDLNSAILLNIVSDNLRVGSVSEQYQYNGVTIYVYQASFSADFGSWKWIPSQSRLRG